MARDQCGWGRSPSRSRDSEARGRSQRGHLALHPKVRGSRGPGAAPRVCRFAGAAVLHRGAGVGTAVPASARSKAAPRAPGLSAATWVAAPTLQRPDTAAGRHGQRPAPGASPATPSSAAGLSPPALPAALTSPRPASSRGGRSREKARPSPRPNQTLAPRRLSRIHSGERRSRL